MLVSEKRLTLEAYFALEEPMEIRHEFVNGELIEMLGESTSANQIAGNLYVFLRPLLKGTSFKIYSHDIKLLIEHLGNIRYPDLLVIHAAGDHHKYVTQPVLIVEVLSESTEREDAGPKLREYTSIPSLQYYLLVSQDEKLVQVNRRLEKSWAFDFYDQPDDIIEFPEWNARLTLSEVYEGISFESQASK